VDEGFLKTLLHDVFGIVFIASEPNGSAQNPCVMPSDQDFERLTLPALGGGNKHQVIVFFEDIGR
jgi:hypothetical protein